MHQIASKVLSCQHMQVKLVNKVTGRRITVVTSPSKMSGYLLKNYLSRQWKKVGEALLID